MTSNEVAIALGVGCVFLAVLIFLQERRFRARFELLEGNLNWVSTHSYEERRARTTGGW